MQKILKQAQWDDVYGIYCKFHNKFGVFVSDNIDYLCNDEVSLSYISFMRNNDLHPIGEYIILFDDEESANEFYQFFNNSPIESSDLYAMLVNSNGECIDENT